MVFQWAILSRIREPFGMTEEWFEDSLHMELYVLLTISLPVWLYFIIMDSRVTKGSIGKRMMKLRVYSMNEISYISLARSFKRTFFKLLPWEIAHLGVIFPTPLYFQKEPEIRVLTIFGIILFIIYMISILTSKKGQAIYDYILGTRVLERQRQSELSESPND